MTINWFGVLLGYVVDSLVTTLMLMLMPGDVATSYVAGPQLSRPEHLLLFIGSAVSTGIGSYVAGRIGKADGAVHGALVWAVGIVMLQLELLGSGDGLPKVMVLAGALALLLGVAGGWLSRFPQRSVA